MRCLPLLRQPDVIDQRAGGGKLGAAEIAKPVERLDAIKFLQPATRAVAVETRVGQRRQRRLPLGEQLEQCRPGQHALGQQDLAGGEAGEIAGERRLAGRRQRKGAGREIEPGEAHLAAGLGEPRQIVVTARVEQPLLGQGAGGDDADHRPAQHLGAAPPRLGRVLDLVADRDLEPGADQPGEIGLGGMDRDAAHRNVGALVLAALGQRDVERLCTRRPRPRKTARKNRPSERTAGSPGWPA